MLQGFPLKGAFSVMKARHEVWMHDTGWGIKQSRFSTDFYEQW